EGLLDALQMTVLECRGVLQAVTEESVDADVREPDQRQLDAPVCIGQHADDGEGDRADGRVQGVVEPRPDPRPCQVPGEGETAKKKKDKKKNHAKTLVKVEDERADEES